MLYGVATDIGQCWAGDQQGQAAGAGDSDIEPIFAVQKLDVARHAVAVGGGHGDDGDFCFLPLKFVYRSHPRTRWEFAAQQIYLDVVRRHHQDIGDAHIVFLAVAVLVALRQEVVVQIGHDVGFFFAALGATFVSGRYVHQPGRAQQWVCGVVQYQALPRVARLGL